MFEFAAPVPVIALTTGEIVSIIVAIVVILSGIFGQAAEAKKTQQKKRARREAAATPGSLDDLASRRRQQLEALAQQRRSGDTARPAALSGQAADRAASRAEFEAGAAAKREMGAVNEMLSRGQRMGEGSRVEADRVEALRRRAALELQAQQQRSARSGKKQRRGRQKPPRLPAEPKPAPRARLGSGVSERMGTISDLGRGVTTVETSVHAGAYADEVHRHVADVAEAPAAQVAQRSSPLAKMIAGRGWRDIFVLKEVLDPPLAMRPIQEQSDPFSI